VVLPEAMRGVAVLLVSLALVATQQPEALTLRLVAELVAYVVAVTLAVPFVVAMCHNRVIHARHCPPVLRGLHALHRAAAALAAANLGITVIPALALFQFRLPELVVRPLPLPGLVRTLYVIRRDGRSLSVAAQGLLDLLLAHPVHTDSEA
jgi:DNA-binding transcriptional LysR family regulator